MTASDSAQQDNCSKEKDTKATVSIRSMSTSVWNKARIASIQKGYTLAQYISELIEKDTSNE